MLWIRYVDGKGQETERFVSPSTWTRWHKRLRALCLGRQEYRQFYISQIAEFRMVPAHEVQMGTGETAVFGDQKGSHEGESDA